MWSFEARDQLKQILNQKSEIEKTYLNLDFQSLRASLYIWLKLMTNFWTLNQTFILEMIFDREPSRSYTYLWSFHFILPSFHVLSENRVNSHHLLQSTDWTVVSSQAVVRQWSGSYQKHVYFTLILWKMLLICHSCGHWKSFAWPC